MVGSLRISGLNASNNPKSPQAHPPQPFTSFQTDIISQCRSHDTKKQLQVACEKKGRESRRHIRSMYTSLHDFIGGLVAAERTFGLPSFRRDVESSNGRWSEVERFLASKQQEGMETTTQSSQ